MAGVIRAGVNGTGVKKGPAEKGPIRYLDSSNYGEHAGISLVVQILFFQKLANFLRYISPVKTVMILVETIWKISL